MHHWIYHHRLLHHGLLHHRLLHYRLHHRLLHHLWRRHHWLLHHRLQLADRWKHAWLCRTRGRIVTRCISQHRRNCFVCVLIRVLSTSRTPYAHEMELTGLLTLVVNREPVIDTGARAQGRGFDVCFTDLCIMRMFALQIKKLNEIKLTISSPSMHLSKT